mmetsp:Transcript_5999/g.16870  ORF Transcript_5999/g.16870 Transcript_5999/m.16870 type:complete len:90 (+) Transcript_5999:1663-1932(+)
MVRANNLWCLVMIQVSTKDLGTGGMAVAVGQGPKARWDEFKASNCDATEIDVDDTSPSSICFVDNGSKRGSSLASLAECAMKKFRFEQQ